MKCDMCQTDPMKAERIPSEARCPYDFRFVCEKCGYNRLEAVSTEAGYNALLKEVLGSEYVAAGGDPDEWRAFTTEVESMTLKERWVYLGFDPEAFDRLTEKEVTIELVNGALPEDPGPAPSKDDVKACAEWFRKKMAFDMMRHFLE